MIDNYSYYLKFEDGNGYECTSGAYHDGVKLPTNRLRFSGGVGQYKTSGGYKSLNPC